MKYLYVGTWPENVTDNNNKLCKYQFKDILLIHAPTR